MAHFRSVIRGQRGEASRLGSKQSGMMAHVDGWHTGVTVHIHHVDGEDRIEIYRTTGSDPSGARSLIAHWSDDQPTEYPAKLKADVDALIAEVTA